MNFDDFNNTLTEKRRGGDKNVKRSLSDELMDVIDDNDIYVHFTYEKKVGINPQGDYSTPIGVYGWQLNAFKNEIKGIVKSETEFFKKEMKKSEKSIIKKIEKDKKKLAKNPSGPERRGAELDIQIGSEDLAKIRKGAEGHFIEVKNVFPYRSDAPFVYLLRAKKGINWLRLNSGRMSDNEFQSHLKTLETYFLNEKDFHPFFKAATLNQGNKKLHWWDSDVLKKYGIKSGKERMELRKKIKEDTDLAKLWYWRMSVLPSSLRYSRREPNNDARLYVMVDQLLTRFYSGGTTVGAGAKFKAVMQTRIFRMLGFDAIRDDGGAILWSSDEPSQVVFLHSGAYKVHRFVHNSDTTRQDRISASNPIKDSKTGWIKMQ